MSSADEKRDRSPMAERRQGEIGIMLPVFNDWNALARLLIQIDDVLSDHQMECQILVVDDGSTVPVRDRLTQQSWCAITAIDVLRLRRNLGHQRAIAVGMAFVEKTMALDVLVIMDGDGEDDPSDIPQLLNKCADSDYTKIVFAERTKRSESWMFLACYSFYKFLFRLLTGHRLRVGNFSVVPASRLSSLVAVSEMWNHYAAGVFKSRQPFCTVPSTRARRLNGNSRLDFGQLVIHGLSSIAVYSDVVGVRLLIASCALVLLTSFGIVIAVGIRLFTDLAVPGWATYTTGLLLVILIQAIMLSVIFSFTSLSDRQHSAFLPIRDYANFVATVERVYRADKVANVEESLSTDIE